MASGTHHGGRRSGRIVKCPEKLERANSFRKHLVGTKRNAKILGGIEFKRTLSSIEREPIFVVRPPLLAPVGLGLIFGFFGLFVLSSSESEGIFVFGIYVLLLVWYFASSSTYEFYESHFVRRLRGKVHQRVNYNEVVNYRCNPSRTSFRSSQFVITGFVDGKDLAFIVAGDPFNEDLDTTLSEWFKKKHVSGN